MTRKLAGVVLVCAAAAQLPHIGDIDFYGLRKITAGKILGAINLAPGGTVPASKGELEDRIAHIPGVAAVQVEAVCCEENRVALFIGIEERGSTHIAFHSQPAGAATLPPDLMDAYRQFLGAELRAGMNGAAGEDLTAGHALSADPAVRGFEDRFLAMAAGRAGLFHDVLHDGPEPEQRAAAASMLAYAPDKKGIAGDLLFAVQDPDEGVRATAMRALAAIAVWAQKKPDAGIRIAPTWFVELLNSVVLSDRVESTKTLLILTDGGNAAALDLIRERALAALIEMARWKALRYALPPFLLLGRVAGLPDEQTRQSWEKGDREPVIKKALAAAAKKRRE
jgi:hypothetical protein